MFATERLLRVQTEQSERQLADSERRLAEVLASTTDGVMVLDTQWRFTFANKNAVDKLFSGRKWLGLPIWELFPGAQNSEFYKNYSRAMQQQTTVEFEAYFPPSREWLEVHAFPTPDGGLGRRIAEVLRRPFDIEGTAITLGASIGIATAPRKREYFGIGCNPTTMASQQKNAIDRAVAARHRVDSAASGRAPRRMARRTNAVARLTGPAALPNAGGPARA